MEQLWTYIKIAAADTIRESVEPSFADMPGPMKTCRFTMIDLGDIPLKMDNIVVHPLTNGAVQFDLDLVWDGECDIQCKVDYIGSFGVRELKLSGRMAIVLKPLTNELPVVSGIQYGFINPPDVELRFCGLASVAQLSVLDKTVKDAIQSSLSTVVLPRRKLYKMSANNNFLDTYQPPLGVARITVCKGRGFVTEERILAKNDIPDVYLNVTLGTDDKVWRTKTIWDDCNPEWNEQAEFCLYDREQLLRLHAWDEDQGPLDPDDDLGKATASVVDLLCAPKRTIELALFEYNKKEKIEEETGSFVTVSCDLVDWTTDLLSLKKASSTIHRPICGLLVVIVTRAFDLPLERTAACTYVKLTYGKKEFDSNTIYDYPGWDSLNPIYDSAFTIPITPDMPRDDDSEVKLDLINSSGEKCIILGSTTITFGSLKELPNNTLTEQRQIGEYGASLEFRVSLSGVDSSGDDKAGDSHVRLALPPGTSSPTRPLPRNPTKQKADGHGPTLDSGGSTEPEPIGTVRVTVVRGKGLKIQEELFNIDVPDVYCELFFESICWKTSVKHDSVSPIWNESKDLVLMYNGQIITIKGWDKHERDYDPDVLIGSAKTTVGKLLLAGGSMILELKKDGRATGVSMTLRCDMVE